MNRNTIALVSYLTRLEPGTIINKDVVAISFSVGERTVREVLKTLHKNLTLTTFALKGSKGCYVVYDDNNENHHKMFARELNTLYKHWTSYYFNNIVKYKPNLRDEVMKSKLGQIEMILKGDFSE